MSNDLLAQATFRTKNLGAADIAGREGDRACVPRREFQLMGKDHWLAAVMSAVIALGLVSVLLNRDDRFFVYMCFAAVGPPLAVIDLVTRRLPDRLTLPAYPALLLCLLFTADASTARAVQACTAMLAAFGLLCVLTDTGYGDLKLAGLLGLVLGSRSWYCLFTGSVYGWCLAAVWAAYRILQRQSDGRLPLGPPLIAGAFVAMLW